MSKVVLAYSGGLDTSVAIRWLMDHYGYEVVTVTVDVGQGLDEEAIRRKALDSGASSAHCIDARDEFIRDFAFRALRAGAMYEDRYPLASALSRPLITRLLIEVARREGADSIAHGCTGKGNDQVRFDVSASALAPDLTVIAPAREWGMSREEEIEYALSNSIPVSQGKQNPYSIDSNLWGRSIECGVLEDPWQEPPEDIYRMTRSAGDWPREAGYVEIAFERGVPVSLDGAAMDAVDLVERLNVVAGAHGVGRIDHVENRLVGIKSREIYEAPAAIVLLTAHRDLEDLTLTRDVARCKRELEAVYADLIYNGLWYSPLREALDGFMDRTQEDVTGTVRVRMHSGNLMVVGRRSPCSLYDTALATYDRDDAFDHGAAVGFITIWGLPTLVAARVKQAGNASVSREWASLPAAGEDQGGGRE